MHALAIFLICCVFLAARVVHAGEVSLWQDERDFRIGNGELAVVVQKSTGRVTSVVMGGQELLGGGTGYWSMAAGAGRQRVSGFGISREQGVTIDPAMNGGERVEVVCRFQGNGADQAYPGNAEIRYALGRDSTTLHATAVMEHGEGDAPFHIGEGRFVIKLDPEIFDQLTVDKARNRVMPTGRDWDAGEPLNMKEARRMTTGSQAGWAEHKYSYSAMLGEVPAYGWVGSKRSYGVWMINPSMEYIAGGPTKMELTGHLDVGGAAMPTLLNMWHGSHYGGTVLTLERDEKWSRVIGPFAIHFNKGGKPDALWRKALAQAEVERRAWPYGWVRLADYPVAEARGGIEGKVRIEGAEGEKSRGDHIWVGLTAADYQVRGRWSRDVVGWQRDGKNYQYWVKAGKDGVFRLTGVRPGNHVLRVFADGVLGEYAQGQVRIDGGAVRQAGEIVWKPERAGPTLWEIGVPDRSAAEFRNGDRYWHWGNYLKYKKDFPKGVDYVVGKSDWRKDWHVCQPLDLSEDCEVLGSSTWRVRFRLDEVPEEGARLRISFCGSRQGAELFVVMNGGEVGETGPLPENGAMHRDSHRGMWFERSFAVPADRLKKGENVLELRLEGSQWHQGVLYDCLRMEAVERVEKSS